MYRRQTSNRTRLPIQAVRMEGVGMASVYCTGVSRKGPNGTEG